MLQLRKLPWKWAWLEFFWPGCPNVAWGLPVEAKKCNWKRNNAHHKTFKCGRAATHRPTDPATHQVTTTPHHHQLSRPPNQAGFIHSLIPRVMRIRITCLCALTEWHTWIGLVDGEAAGSCHISQPTPSPPHSASGVVGFGSVISFPHTAFTDEPKCISLLTVVANLRWVFHSKQIAPVRIKCAHTNCPRTCKNPG